MKKILLSSIIMLGVCGAVNAQTGSKFKKNEASTSAAAPAPQKAAIMPASDAAPVAAPAERTAADKAAAADVAPATPAQTKAQMKQQQAAAAATTVNAAGVVMTDEEKVKADKAEKAKAAGENDKKNQQ